jgi:hypothetical protein
MIALVGLVVLTSTQIVKHVYEISNPAGQPNATAPKPVGLGQPPASPEGEESELQVRQNGNQMEFSTDGGKTWSSQMPAGSGISVNVKVVEE